MRKAMVWASLAAALLLTTGVRADAGSVMLNFNSNNTLPTPSLAAGSGAGAIQNYLNQAICGSSNCGAVTVYGSTDGVNYTQGVGVVADAGYDGEGHVVGATQTTPVTLGTSDNGGAFAHGTCTANANPCTGSVDNFLRNDGQGSTVYTSFRFVFNNMSITSVQFDYDIFPDGTCATLGSCATPINRQWNHLSGFIKRPPP